MNVDHDERVFQLDPTIAKPRKSNFSMICSINLTMKRTSWSVQQVKRIVGAMKPSVHRFEWAISRHRSILPHHHSLSRFLDIRSSRQVRAKPHRNKQTFTRNQCNGRNAQLGYSQFDRSDCHWNWSIHERISSQVSRRFDTGIHYSPLCLAFMDERTRRSLSLSSFAAAVGFIIAQCACYELHTWQTRFANGNTIGCFSSTNIGRGSDQSTEENLRIRRKAQWFVNNLLPWHFSVLISDTLKTFSDTRQKMPTVIEFQQLRDTARNTRDQIKQRATHYTDCYRVERWS